MYKTKRYLFTQANLHNWEKIRLKNVDNPRRKSYNNIIYYAQGANRYSSYAPRRAVITPNYRGGWASGLQFRDPHSFVNI